MFSPGPVARMTTLKPPLGASLNWSHPLCRGLRFYALLNDYGSSGALTSGQGEGVAKDLVSGALGTGSNFGPVGHIVGDRGIATGRGAVATQFMRWERFSGFNAEGMHLTNITTAPLLVAVKLRLLAAGGNAANNICVIGRAVGNAQTTGYRLGYDGTATNVLFQCNSTLITASGMTTNAWYTVFGLWDGTNLNLYVFNELGGLISNPTAVAFAGPITSALSGFGLFDSSGGSFNDTLNGLIEWGAVWNDWKPVSVLQSLARNPYQLIQETMAQRRWLFPPGLPVQDWQPAVYIPRRLHADSQGRQKPPCGSLVNWDHPLTRGLRFYWNGDELGGKPGDASQFVILDKVGRHSVQAQSVANVSLARQYDDGTALSFNAATNSFVRFGVDRTVPPTAPLLIDISNGIRRSFTMAMKFRSIEPGDGVGDKPFFSFAIAGAPKTGFAVFSGNGVEVFCYGNIPAVSFATTDGTWQTLFLVSYEGISGFAASFTAKGVLIGNSTFSGQVPGFATSDLVMGGAADGTALAACDIEWCAVWNIALDLAACQQLASRPYQLLKQPRAQVEWFLDLVGAPPAAFGGEEELWQVYTAPKPEEVVTVYG